MNETQAPGELAYQAAQLAAGFGDPYAEDAAQEAYPTQEYDDTTYQLNHPENAPQTAPDPYVILDPASPRTFYRSDYGRAARLIQAARHVPGDPYTAKPEGQQYKVNKLAVAIAELFAADSLDRFDADKFFAASALPVKPQASDPDEDDGGPGDYFEVTPDDWNGTPEESDPA